MKKSLLAMLLAVALVAPIVAAEKNMWIGGTLGYQSATEKWGDSYDYSLFSIAPEFGYSLDKTWDIGLDLSYSTGKGEKSSGRWREVNSSPTDITKYGIAPFARYHIAKVAGIDVMIKGSLFYNKGEWKNSTNNKTTEYGIAIAPVVSYSINDTWSIGATLNFLELGYLHQGDDDDSDWKYDEFGFNLNDGSLISIGFSYHF